MHIFIDESGTFSGAGAAVPSVSVVGALVLPSHKLQQVFGKYAKLRHNFPRNAKGEVKGSRLSEPQVSAVLETLRKNGALFFAAVIDLAAHTPAEIEEHRAALAAGLAVNLTDEHTHELRAGIARLQDRLLRFPSQLFVQGAMQVALLNQVIEEALNFYSQRWPQELGHFHWVVDAKNPVAITDWEDWWSVTLAIWLQAMTVNRPAKMFADGDFRHLQRFTFDELPDYLKSHVPRAVSASAPGLKLGLLLNENFRFSSEPEPGLELVDIATNALRRGLVGNLQEEGWLPLRRLMIHRPDIYVQVLGFVREEERPVARSLLPVLNRFRKDGKMMLTGEHRRSGAQ
jgi:hypothetical protein